MATVLHSFLDPCSLQRALAVPSLPPKSGLTCVLLWPTECSRREGGPALDLGVSHGSVFSLSLPFSELVRCWNPHLLLWEAAQASVLEDRS